MKIHVVQREGTRYFSRFTNLAERDRLTVELQIEDKNGQKISIDLTEALIEEYSKHPQIGKVSAHSPFVEIASLQPIKPLTTKRSKTVSPAYLADSPHADILSKVREAQVKAAGEKKQKQAEFAAARAERLVAAREAKKSKVAAPKAKKVAEITKAQAQAIKKIGKVLAKEEKGQLTLGTPSAKTPRKVSASSLKTPNEGVANKKTAKKR